MTTTSRSRFSARRRLTHLTHAAGQPGMEGLEPRTLLAADPITGNHPLWTAISGGAKINGVIRPAEWAGAFTVTRTQAHVDGSNVTLMMKYSARGLMIAADVRDTRLWADGTGNGAGPRWEFWHDDAIALFFDPRNSRARNLPATGRMLAFNLGGMKAPINGGGKVSRYEYLRGNGHGLGAHINFDGSLTPGVKWATRIRGTVNNNTDIDIGWTAEVMIPWAFLGMSGPPLNGRQIGMNFELFDDNDGGDVVVNYYGTDPDPNKRLGDRVIDDHYSAVTGSFNYANSGWQGPTNYAILQFVDRAATDQPRAVADLSVSQISGYGVRLDFRSPAATQAGKGHVAGYDLRISTMPITTEAEWNSAATIENNFVPHLRNRAEKLNLGGLTPDTGYHIAVRARDHAGRLSDISSVSFTTLSTLEDASGGQRVIVSPHGNTLVTESGDPFIMVGGTIGVTSLYSRTLYAGQIWNPNDQTFINFSQRANNEGTIDGYFESLASYGVNTLRVQLERVVLENSSAARSQLPEGMAWLEWREPGDSQSTFNPAMKQYLHAMMAAADAAGIKFILQTFNNFNYDSNLDLTPFATVNGGSISGMNQFFSSPQVLEMAKTRMEVLADWVRESPHAHTMIGFELVNEWDGGNPHDIADMRNRAKFLVRLADHLHNYAPEINVLSTTIGLQPRGPVARALFYSDAFDMLDPHFYTPSTAEPVNNPAADKTVRPAIDYGALAAYWLTNRRDNRPIHNAEWDLVGTRWSGGSPYYSGYSSNADPARPYSMAQDEAIYRVTSWTSIAAGLAGSGLRIGGSEMRDTYPSTISPTTTGYVPFGLTIGMREIQASVSAFVRGEGSELAFDWSAYQARTLAGRLGFTNAGNHHLRAWGSTDDDQGLVYVLRDAGRGGATVSDASLQIEGLTRNGVYEFEFWSTGAEAAVVGRISGIIAGLNTTVTLPTFTSDVMIKFRRAG